MATILFDLDGTICDITHRLHHVKDGNKNWDAFYRDCIKDAPKNDIIEFLHCMNDADHKILIVSGRSDQVRAETEDWLERHDIPYEALHMRPNGSYVPDNALKKAWLDQGVFGPKENILFVVEDRDRMVKMWRACGLTCLQVDQWDEEGEVSHPVAKIRLAADMAEFISSQRMDDRFNQWRKAK